jgi:uncharacterized protein Smg (DUF494 family)
LTIGKIPVFRREQHNARSRWSFIRLSQIERVEKLIHECRYVIHFFIKCKVACVEQMDLRIW